MEPQQTGVRNLKNKLSQYLRSVKDGETVVITEHGEPIGRIIPYDLNLEQKLEMLRESNLISWSGNRLTDRAPKVKANEEQTISDLIVEERESE